MMLGFGSFACSLPQAHADDIPNPTEDIKASADQTTATAIFAGGCFWCTEAAFEQLPGVSDVVSGYCGGTKDDATYEKVCSGNTNHAEAIKITYNPQKITFGQLMKVLFFTIDPTTKDRQGPDSGRQYRSAVFYQNDDEKRIAEAYIKQLNDAKTFSNPIVTTVEPVGEGFFAAEGYHQDYARNNPDQPYIARNATPKADKVKAKFGEQEKK